MRKWHVEKMSSYAAGSLPTFHNAPEKNLCRINEQIAFPLFFFFLFYFLFSIKGQFPSAAVVILANGDPFEKRE